jgi:hypothetical protein
MIIPENPTAQNFMNFRRNNLSMVTSNNALMMYRFGESLPEFLNPAAKLPY